MTYTTLKNAKIAEKIDYVAYSQASKLEFDLPPYINNDWKAISPLRHYTHGQENTQGVKRFWNDYDSKQGRYVILSGQPLDTIVEFRQDFLQWVHTSGKKATRIDYALDIIHSSLTPRLVRKHLLAGEAVTHAKSADVAGDLIEGGDTQYVGKKTAETYTRIYDKQIEQQTDFKWVRIETVYQGERASPSLQVYLENKTVRPLIRKHLDFPNWKDYQKLMAGEAVKLDLPSKIRGTRAWLIGQVCKVIAKELLMSDGKEFWQLMQDQILLELARFQELS